METVKLKYGKWSTYNDPKTNERQAELPLSFWFIEKFNNDVIEIGEVTDFYKPAAHTVYDLVKERESTIQKDAFDVDYKGKNVLSISTVEHVDSGDYGNPADKHRAVDLIKKIIDESDNYLISFPVGANRRMEDDILEKGYRYILLERNEQNFWRQANHTDFNKYEYNYPHYAGNAIAVLTNLDIKIEFERPDMTEEDFMTIEQLGDKWPYDWVSTRGLAPYIKRLDDNVVGLEIGTCRAESTAYLLDKCPNITKLYTVDPYKAYQDWIGEINQEIIDKFMMIAQENVKPFGDRVQMIRETSLDAATKIRTILNTEDETPFDFIFVDGDHSYEATLADCEAYYPLLKKGGFFCGHDYQSLDTVRRAVDDFRDINKITAPLNLSLNSAFFWYK